MEAAAIEPAAQSLWRERSNSVEHGFRTTTTERYDIISTAYGNGLTIIASTEPLQPHQRELFMQHYDEGRALLESIGIKDGLPGFERRVSLGDETLKELSSRAPSFSNSDDMPSLEFRWLPGGMAGTPPT